MTHYARMRNHGNTAKPDIKRPWTPAEDRILAAVYAEEIHPNGFLAALSRQLGRSRYSISIRAGRLGLTDNHKKKVPYTRAEHDRANYVSEAKYATEAERRAAQGAALSRRWREQGHPRGALGMQHSQEARQKISVSSTRAWRNPKSGLNSDSNRQRLSDAMTQRIKDGVMPSGEQVYSRTKAGRRADLADRYFRSSWEANYARYLNWLIARRLIRAWDYECETFWFEAIKRGTRSYTPDFRVEYTDGHHEWHEVKGWMDPKSRTRLDRMARYYPEERVIVIDADWFKWAKRRGINRIVPWWE